MIKIKSIRIKNLRSLADTGDIELKPITILVGRNSSGKSTFARVFPLLRQSIEANKRGPILWWGRLVDFGSFNEALNRNAKEQEISLELNLSFEPEDIRSATRRGLGRLSVLRLLTPGDLRLLISFKDGEKSAYISKISLSVFDSTADISLDEQGLLQGITSGTYSWKPSAQVIGYAPQDRLVPSPSFFKSSEKEAGDNPTAWESLDLFGIELPKYIRSFVHGNTADARVRQLANKIPLGPRKEIFSHLFNTASPSSFRETLSHYGEESRLFNHLCDLAFVSQLDGLLDQINNALNATLSEVVYLEPLRATAQRYYRQQSLAVGEIDSKGENIAMFLDSLGSYDQSKFRAWTSKHFGIEVVPKKEGGHISLAIKQNDGGGEANIADMGFGYSQMLPIAAQLWAASESQITSFPGRRKSLNPVIVIEQPELHLHPDFQAKLATVFAATVSNKQSSGNPAQSSQNIRIIAETHSPSLINRLGEMVADKKLNKSDIQVVLFEQENSNSPSKVTISEFDDEGVLTNWPVGFFEPFIEG